MASTYAAKLLADQGARVLKVEPFDGDPLRSRRVDGTNVDPSTPSGTFMALNTNKESIQLDAGEDLTGLINWADIVVHDFPPDDADELGLGPTTYDRHRGLVVLAITPYGSSGPHAGWRGEEINVANAGGWAALTPSTKADPKLAPLKVFGHQCALLSGTVGAMTALATHREQRSSGAGEFIDVSQQAYVASVLEAALPNLSYTGVVSYRHHPRRLTPWRILQAQDAPIFLICVEQDQWDRLVDFMGRPDWATVSLFDDLAGRSDNADLIHALLQEFVGQWKALDLYHAAQAHRVCFAPVFSFADLVDNEHLEDRGFIKSLDTPTGPVPTMASASRVDGRRAALTSAPQLGSHRPVTERRTSSPPRPARLPLQGIRVVDFSWAWAGPFCSLMLAHLGAEVIRLESASRLDIYRRYMINPPELTPGTDTSGMFNQWNQGKRSVELNLRDPKGIDIAKRLIAASDVVVQNFATGVMDRLGLSYDELRAINPRIVLASISGYGQTGPWREYMGYGPAAAPLTGLCRATGYLGASEDEIGLSMPDPTAGLTAAWEVVAALAKRDETGRGVHIDTSLWEATAVLAVEGWMHFATTGEALRPNGNRDAWMAPHGCFRCAGDEAWVSIAIPDDAAWRRFVTAIDDDVMAARTDLDDLAGRREHEDWIEERVTAWTRERDRWEISEALQAVGIPAFPSMSSADIVVDPHLNARGFVERLDHAVVGRRAHAGIPWRFTERSNGVRRPAPRFGADTDDVLERILGLSADEIAKLRHDKTLY